MKPVRSTAPAGSLLHPGFLYVRAAETDVARTFARVRRARQPWPLTSGVVGGDGNRPATSRADCHPPLPPHAQRPTLNAQRGESP